MLLSRSALAIWNSVAEGKCEAFDDWHVNEHIPERLSVPGFLRGRRYLATDSDRYFTLYETTDSAVLSSAAYLERLNNPTPWTSLVVPLVTSRRRTALRVSASLGSGIGGALSTIEFGPADGRGDALRRWIVEDALPNAVAAPRIVAAHCGEADVDRSRLDTAEERLMDSPDDVARWVIMLEGFDAAAARDAARLIQDELVDHGALPDTSVETLTLTYLLESK